MLVDTKSDKSLSRDQNSTLAQHNAPWYLNNMIAGKAWRRVLNY